MSLLAPAIFVTMVSAVILSLCFAYLYSLEHKRPLLLWSHAWAVSGLRYGFMLAPVLWGGHFIYSIGGFTLSILAGLLILQGSFAFVDRPMNRWWWRLAVAAGVWAIVSLALEMPFLLAVAPLGIFAGVVYCGSAVLILRSPTLSGAGKKVAGAALILYGLHMVDYPVLRPLDWFAPWGYFLAAGLEMVIALGLVLAFYQKSRAGLLSLQGKLLDEQERYRLLLNSGNDAIYVFPITDQGGFENFIEVNEVACRRMVYSRAEFLSMSPPDVISPRNRHRLPQVLLLLLQKGRTIFQSEHVGKDGSIWPVEVSAHRFDFKGQILVMAIARDMTERLCTEAELRRSEEKFSRLFNASPAWVSICDINDGRLLMVNDTFCALTGFSRQEAIGKTMVELGLWVDPQVREKNIRELEQKSAIRNAEVEMRFGDGQVHNMLWSAEPIQFEGKRRLLNVMVDISDRQRLEKALKLSEEKFVKAFNTSPVCVVITSAKDGRLLEVNDTYCRITGYGREAILGKTADELGMWIHPGDRRRLQDILGKDGALNNLEIALRFKDGQAHTMLACSRPIELDGQPCFINVLVEITELKKAQDDQEHLAEQLRQAQKMEAIGTLAGGVAHDFNNVLSVIMGYAELAQDELARGREPGHELDEILSAGERARSLLKQLMTFSRRMQSQLSPLDANQVVKEAVKLLERTLPKMISIQSRLDPGLAMVNADATQLEQVFMNLGTNAADAMPSGGQLSFMTRNHRLTPAAAAAYPDLTPGDYVVVQVSDTGEGMPPEIRQHIFEPFFTTKAQDQGTGLGLSTAVGILKNHGGGIYCHSEPGKGSRFELYLPAYKGQAAQDHKSQALPAGFRGGSERLLVVDDESALRNIAAHILQRVGYQVELAESGEDALEKYGRFKPDLVLMDLGMPGMGGIRACEAILADDPAAKIIIASGYSPRDQMEQLIKMGGKGFLAKPYRSAQLLEKVRRILDGLD